jgi:DNA-binding CsgD family transcriptional regulator
MNQIQAKIIEPGALTPKETEVLALICEGKPDKLIARQLAISIRTVEHHCDHIYEKLAVRSNSVNARCAAIAAAVARGMVLLSTRLLCLVLMLGSVDPDQAARVGRLRLPRVHISRAREG